MRYDIVEATADTVCECTNKHVPKPMAYMVVKTRVGSKTLCPTAFHNLRMLLAEYEWTDGEPLGSVTKHYGKFVRDLADQIYEGSEDDVHGS